MKSKLLALLLVLSFVFIGCGTQEETVESEPETETAADVDVEEETDDEPEKESKLKDIYESTFEFGEEGTYSIEWSKRDNEKECLVCHKIKSNNIGDIAFAAQYVTIYYTKLLEHYEDFSFILMVENDDLGIAYSIDPIMGVSGKNLDGSSIDNEYPDWFSEMPEDVSDMMDTLLNEYRKEEVYAKVYLTKKQ